MLSKQAAHATLPASDLERAKRFYADKLGLTPLEETPGGIRYRCAGTEFMVFPSGGASNASFTQMGWLVDSVGAEVAELKKRGVVFEEYDLPSLKTIDGIATSPAGKSAWFKDSEGNLLGLFQAV